MKFLHLLEFELKRFFPFGISLMFGIIITQIIFYTFQFRTVASEYTQQIPKEQSALCSLFFYNGPGNFSVFEVLPVAVSIAMIGLYIFFIWYRDWRGSSPVIYRLLMLPIGRTQIFFTKLSAIVIYTFSIVFTQLLTLWIIYQMYQRMIPAAWQDPCSFEFFLARYPFSFFLPDNLMNFIGLYGMGIAFVILIFTCILLERSFHWKGLLAGILWFNVNIALLLASESLNLLWYEFLILFIVLIVCLTGINLYLSRYLLKNKVAV